MRKDRAKPIHCPPFTPMDGGPDRPRGLIDFHRSLVTSHQFSCWPPAERGTRICARTVLWRNCTISDVYFVENMRETATPPDSMLHLLHTLQFCLKYIQHFENR
ncbi:hypothetical protein BaRGS_00018023 [Batillaria attramentaria]|uniref:Uncharacterized protein n=1 Tax=Batillaria attramentaria TaxID=370345 RepID=A0ABD0KV96_9CAEN